MRKLLRFYQWRNVTFVGRNGTLDEKYFCVLSVVYEGCNNCSTSTYTIGVFNNAVHTHVHPCIRNPVLKTPPKYSKLCTYRYGELTFSYYFFSVWRPHKLRFLAKLLNIPKRAKNGKFIIAKACQEIGFGSGLTVYWITFLKKTNAGPVSVVINNFLRQNMGLEKMLSSWYSHRVDAKPLYL